MVKPPAYGWGLFLVLCALTETRGIRIYPLPLLVDAFHILPFLPRIADRVSFESALSNCLFVLVFQPHLYADALAAGVRELVRLHPFCNILQRHNLMVLCLIVDTGKVAAYTAMVLFHCH